MESAASQSLRIAKSTSPKDRSPVRNTNAPSREAIPPRGNPVPVKDLPVVRNASSAVRGGSPIVPDSSPTTRGGLLTVAGGSPTARGGSSTTRGGSSTGRGGSSPAPPLAARQGSIQDSGQGPVAATPLQETRFQRFASSSGKALKSAQDEPRKGVVYTLVTYSTGLFAASIAVGNDAAHLIPKGKGIYATVFGIGGVVTGIATAKVARTGEINEHASVQGITNEQAREHSDQSMRSARATIFRATLSASIGRMFHRASANDLAAPANLPPLAVQQTTTTVAAAPLRALLPGRSRQNPVQAASQKQSPAPTIPPASPRDDNTPTTSTTASGSEKAGSLLSGVVKKCKDTWDNTCQTTESMVSSAAPLMSWRKPELPNIVRRRR